MKITAAVSPYSQNDVKPAALPAAHYLNGDVVQGATTPEESRRDAEYIKLYTAHRSGPYESARNAYAVVQRELKKVTKDLELAKPPLSTANWDFTMKDGALVSTGKSLTAQDHATIDKELNANKSLTDAVGSLSRAAVAFLQTSNDNPSYSEYTEYTKSVQNFTFDNVSGQMNGKTQFRELMSKTEKYLHPNADTTMDDEGSAVLNVLSTTLTASAPPTPTSY